MSRSRLILLGAVLGLTWAASLRAFMMVIAGANSTFTFIGTFGIILPSGTLIGALLGWAEHRRRTRNPYSWFIPIPLLLVVLPFILAGDATTPLTLAVLGMIGGYSFSGRGPRSAQILAGAVVAAGILIVFLAPKPAGLSAATPYGAWFATLASCLYVVLALACSLPMRRPLPVPSATATPPDTLDRPAVPSSTTGLPE
jgi:hypothetical protein